MIRTTGRLQRYTVQVSSFRNVDEVLRNAIKAVMESSEVYAFDLQAAPSDVTPLFKRPLGYAVDVVSKPDELLPEAMEQVLQIRVCLVVAVLEDVADRVVAGVCGFESRLEDAGDLLR